MQLDNSDLLTLVLQISASNKSFIQLMINHECISFSQLCSDILQVTHEWYTPVESKKFHTALNSFITFYLKFVLCENKKFNLIPKQHVSIFNTRDFFETMSTEFSKKSCKNVYNSGLIQLKEPNFMNYVERLKQFINHSSLNIDFDHFRIIKNSKLFDSCKNVKDTNNSQNALILGDKITKRKQIFAVNDFETFLSPLKEDYSKSSKGYICQNKSQFESTFKLLPENSLLNLSDYSDTDESSFTDDDPLYDNIISGNCPLKNLSSDSDTSLNGRVSNSDSEDSITFSDYFDKCLCDYKAKSVKSNKAPCHGILSSESDSEDSEIFDSSLGNKFFKVSSSNINSFYELNEIFDEDLSEICDKNSSPIYQSLEENLNMDFTFASKSLSQVNMETYSAYFDGFVNPCFEDDDDEILGNELLRNVNDEWERSMQNISCEPREPKKVSFLPMPNLVTIKTFEPDDDGYHFGLYLLNQVRFKNRIEEFEKIIKPYLSEEHRTNIYKNYFSHNQLLI